MSGDVIHIGNPFIAVSKPADYTRWEGWERYAPLLEKVPASYWFTNKVPTVKSRHYLLGYRMITVFGNAVARFQSLDLSSLFEEP